MAQSPLNPPLYIHNQGQGRDIVLLHGWGVNSAVFSPLADELQALHCRVHLVDLPGFGDSASVENNLDTWVQTLIEQLPERAIWMGWSLGGLLATHIANQFPQHVSALVTIASSPCFMAREASDNQAAWAGIPPKVLHQFSSLLVNDPVKTIEQFLAIQAMGSPHAKADIKRIKQLVLAKPHADVSALTFGLSLLATLDLRPQQGNIHQPWLRIWGKLDCLVPRKIIRQLHQASNISDVIINKASHAPFISHKEEFNQQLTDWLTQKALIKTTT
ncbi:pimeloyl-ACP methyl ester esterase BioH [Shewanella intestini]|uniref:Pimeloyl-[acyl-carrier protein] methyl ester esterase n=1 Tax=Shewanella intestini TaxID=2017544 RepID=A0ABS5I428_9GAMM|nr:MULTISPECIES: pimeloyl-ACP methyl ester esterase BioH [Shewanella]MBR9728060.1 pimeloyl-ACP methyl ester esterase BioH [Shewanella intestini]MRG36532.1 pimeloyl-ACP methyl ester esterase BioH [Shewanella sp. XMDDZSB0408]